MVAQLLRLRLRLLANSFQRSPWQIIGLVIGIVYGLGTAGLASAALLGLRLFDVGISAPVVTVGGSLVVLGFLVVPLVFGIDDAMDPRKFALFGVDSKRLADGLAVAALPSVPALGITMLAVSQIVTWSRGTGEVILALVSALLIIITCILGSRVATSLAAFFLSTRRARDATATAGLLLVIVLSPVFILLTNVEWGRDGLDVLDGIAGVAAWTPLGASWSAPASASAGHPREALFQLFIAIATAGLLWVAWRRLVAVMLVTPQRLAQAKVYRGLGFFRLFPSSPTGAIAARSLTYWGRDARYYVSLIVIPIVPLLLIVPLLIAGVPAHYLALLPVPVAALFLSWSIHNDVAFDSTALWVHVVSDTSGRADRLGRVLPTLIVGVPVIVLGSIASIHFYGDASLLAPLIGVSLGLLLSGLGLSSVMSARFPYPVAHPGDSPFSTPQATGTASALIQSLSFFATFVLTSPVLFLAFLAFFDGGVWGILALLVGVVLGVIVLTIGILWGGHIFRRRSTDLLAFAMRN